VLKSKDHIEQLIRTDLPSQSMGSNPKASLNRCMEMSCENKSPNSLSLLNTATPIRKEHGYRFHRYRYRF